MSFEKHGYRIRAVGVHVETKEAFSETTEQRGDLGWAFVMPAAKEFIDSLTARSMQPEIVVIEHISYQPPRPPIVAGVTAEEAQRLDEAWKERGA